ncbi:MAG: arginine--tRNA ligase [Bacteroidales bacterium]|nr:arginine--tRNA ligase [Bacteroidales bacterium]
MRNEIALTLQKALRELYNIDWQIDTSIIQRTKKEFEGDFTLVVFPFVKQARQSPDMVAQSLGDYFQQNLHCRFNIVKGFLNLTFPCQVWINFLKNNYTNTSFGYFATGNSDVTLIEFSSPNTNKPLHLGHIRNNLLGDSVSRILAACGKKVIKVNLVNDRGIHICKSMLAWQKFGNGETPESTQMKGDHLVGKYYVEFDKHYKAEVAQLEAGGMDKTVAEKQAPLMLEAQEMLRKWENNDPEIRQLWNQMNEWVYQGFAQTYQQLGIAFDKVYYESQTYLLGKQLVEEGLQKGAFYRRDDQSVWADLREEGLDEKLLLRSDGTSVYMTQDLGTAQLRYDEFHPKEMIYVVGNEQNYHFDVLKLVIGKKLKKEYGPRIHHLSYGMVELPFGKMKSREGTVVDADDLMEEMIIEAQNKTSELGKTDFEDGKASQLFEMIGLGALKYFILKVDPKKNMLFDPEESIDFNGNTAPFIQYTHARIKSLLRKAADHQINYNHQSFNEIDLQKAELDLVKMLYEFPQIVKTAGEMKSPALIANYAFDLAKEFNRFYQETPIFKETNEQLRDLRLHISQFTALVIKNAMTLLGIHVPEKM